MEKIKRDDLAVKIICFCLSLALWFYVTYEESPNMTKIIHNVPITIEGQSALKGNGFSIYSISEKSVDVRVTAKRLSFLKITNQSLSAVLNVSSLNESGEHDLHVTVTPKVSLSGSSFYVKDSKIKIVIEPIVKKSFAIKADLGESGDSSLIVRESSLSSKNVTVSAPESIINEISSVTTQQIIPDDKNVTRQSNINLIVLGQGGLPIDGVECSPSQIDVSYSFYDVKSVPVRLVTTETPELEAKLLQSEVTIYGYGDTFDKTVSVDTETINLANFSPGAKTMVKLILPDGIKLTNKSSEIDVSIVPAAPTPPPSAE